MTKLRLQSHETVDITTNDDYILTTSPVNGETKASYRLTGGTVTQTAATITIRFVDTDANMIKLNPYFGKNISSTFLSMEYDAGTDLFGNFLESIPSVNARPIDTFVPDTAKPKLLSFIMDMNYEGETYLSMKFNEPVRMSSINVTLLYLQSRFARRDGVFYRLTGGEVVSANSDIVRIRLLPLDLLSVKLIPGLLRRKQSTYLVYSEDLIKDLFGNAVVPELDGAAFPCTEYIVDAVPPKILQAVLNMTEETLTLVMDEPIVLATVDPSQLIMQSKPELPTSAELRALGTYDEIPQDGKKINVLRQQTQDYYDALAFLTYSVSKQTTVRITAPLSTNVTIEFAAADMDSIKSLYPMADGVLTSWMVFRPDGLFDFVGNSLERNYPRNARRVDVFIADAIRPEVETYLLDMNTGKIHLNLSEAVRTESINVAETYLQNDLARRFGVAINLKNCTFVRGSLGNSGMVTISIDAHTMLFLKFNNIGYDAFTSYFSYSDIFALDYNNNRLMPGWDASVVGGKPKAPTTLRPDTTAPKVVRWYLDRSGIQQNKMVQLKIYFDEPVVVSVVSQLSISSYNRNTPVYPLTVLQNNALTLNYSHYNTELTTYLPNYCVTPFKAALTSCTKDFYSFIDNSIAETDKYGLMIAQSTIRDFAKIPNYAESIDIKFYMVAESESGKPDIIKIISYLFQ